MKILWAIVGVVLAAIALGWWASKSIPFVPPRSGSHPGPVKPLSGTPASPLLESGAEPSALPGMLDSSVQPITSNGETNWESQIEEILETPNEDEAVKAKRLLALMPDLPLEGQLETAQHLNSMLPDENYPELASYLTDPETPELLQDVLLAGLLERPDGIRLPLLLNMAEDEQHAMRGDALEYLQSLLGVNTVTNWTQLTSLVEQRIKSEQNGEPSPRNEGSMATQDAGTDGGF